MSDRLNSYDQSIYVTGFMASGKSTLAKAAAKELSLPHIDLDQEIERREGMTIQEMFDKRGESYFRIKEYETLIDLLENFKGIVSLGGGTLQDQKVVDQLKANGILLYVETPLELMVQRVKNNAERPILYDGDGKIKSEAALKTELKALYSNRLRFYEQAHITLDTSKFETKAELVKAAIYKIKRHVRHITG